MSTSVRWDGIWMSLVVVGWHLDETYPARAILWLLRETRHGVSYTLNWDRVLRINGLKPNSRGKMGRG
eukprot:136794-Rhodomonas_salina.3